MLCPSFVQRRHDMVNAMECSVDPAINLETETAGRCCIRAREELSGGGRVEML